MNITVEVIDHQQQRYETCGDWWFDKKGDLCIKVSKLDDWRYETLVTVHELVEVAICKYANVTQKQVDEFDMAFESKRQLGDDSEPGDDNDAPYRVQHCVATGVERVLAACLGVRWSVYERVINALHKA